MTGFIRGLFGGNKGDRVAGSDKRGAFYLDADEAKTFGDIDYMRSAKTVRRTFAKKKGATEEMESVRKLSALGATEVEENGLSEQKTFESPLSQSTFQANKPASEAPKFENKFAERRKPTSNDMDLFRNMAKDIKRR